MYVDSNESTFCCQVTEMYVRSFKGVTLKVPKPCYSKVSCRNVDNVCYPQSYIYIIILNEIKGVLNGRSCNA